MKIITLIQARMTSSRLPGKVKMNISGYPMLWHVWQRAKRITPSNHTVIATGISRKNNWIRSFCKKYMIDCFSGHDTDILKRYYIAAKTYKADIIIRVMADCPLLDPVVSSQVVEELITANDDYRALGGTFPNGLDTEVFTFKLLETAEKKARLSSEREHVTPFMYKNHNRFKCQMTFFPKDLYHLKLSVDRIEDLQLVRSIFKALFDQKKEWFGIGEIENFLAKNTHLLCINEMSIRGEGYKKSLKKEKKHSEKKKSLFEKVFFNL